MSDFELAKGRVLHFNEDSWNRLQDLLAEKHLHLMAQHVAEQRTKDVVVLDLKVALKHMSGGLDDLPWLLKDMRRGGGIFVDRVADQIEAQTNPRIPEPGLWGVVEAGHKHLEGGRRSEFVRVATEGRFQWVEREAEADWCVWADLIDPHLIRPGIGAES